MSSSALALKKEGNALPEPKKRVQERVVCLSGENRGRAFLLLETRMVIGRGADCQIQILDPKASRHHAELVKFQGKVIVTDLSSQNGIIVNDKNVKQAELKNGDKFSVGQTIFQFKSDTRPELTMLTPKLGNHPNEKKKKVILFAVLALVFLLVLSIDTETPLEKIDPGSQVKYDLNEISPSVLNAVERKKNNQNKELSSQTVVITKRGLRELREKNYFRAISEFSHAIDINPNDAQANFYMRRAKDELDSAIKQFNINAVRDMESLQYKKAIVSYCAVVRLLYNYPEDERFKAAEVNITKIEEKLGYEKGEVQCIQK